MLGAEQVPIPLNLKHAMVVRLGEMRILRGLLRRVTARLESSHTPPQSSASATTSESRKRKADGTGTSGRTGRTVKR